MQFSYQETGTGSVYHCGGESLAMETERTAYGTSQGFLPRLLPASFPTGSPQLELPLSPLHTFCDFLFHKKRRQFYF